MYGFEGHMRKGGKPLNDATEEAVKQMTEYAKTQPKGTSSLRDDGVTHVLGPERKGRVRGLGFGATISKIEANGFQKVQAKRLEKLVEERVEQIKHEMRNEIMNEMKSEIMNEMKALLSQNASAGSQSNALPSPIIEELQGLQCELLHWNGSGVVIAKAEIAATDPNALEDHFPIGLDCWKVWIDDVLVSDCPLYRASLTGNFYLRDANTSSVVWPKKFVKIIQD